MAKARDDKYIQLAYQKVLNTPEGKIMFDDLVIFCQQNEECSKVLLRMLRESKRATEKEKESDDE
jgi:hypothetical protein